MNTIITTLKTNRMKLINDLLEYLEPIANLVEEKLKITDPITSIIVTYALAILGLIAIIAIVIFAIYVFRGDN